MSDSDMQHAARVSPSWPERPWILAALGVATGLALHEVSGGFLSRVGEVQAALMAFLAVSAGLIGFTLERNRWQHALVFSLVFGAVAAGISYWSGGPDGSGPNWHYVSLIILIVIVAPLFQSARDTGSMRFEYVAAHDHLWTNLVLWCAAWAFVLICFLLSYLLAGLFDLLKLGFLSSLLEKEFFRAMLIGGAFGGALGLLREQDTIVRTLQRVVTMVLAVLAPVLAAGLILFLLALPFTGLAPLWASRSAATILLLCVGGAFVLINSVIGSAAEHERQKRAFRWSAIALATVMTPLAVLAAVAIGLRIGQYGYTPDRLWALTFVILTTVVAIAYLGAVIRGRMGYAAFLRPTNLKLAFGLTGISLLLATPLLGFNAISARDQVARLESGKVTPEAFDWHALRFDFGAAGQDALKNLQRSANPSVRERAAATLSKTNQFDRRNMPTDREVAEQVRVLPKGATLPEGAFGVLRGYLCDPLSRCTVMIIDPDTFAVLTNGCRTVAVCGHVSIFRKQSGKWLEPGALGREVALSEAEVQAQRQAFDGGEVEVREVTRRQIFIAGKPIGDPFE